MANEKRHVPNPYVGREGYHCFGCDPENPHGLRLSFWVEGETLRAQWTPRSELEGYPGVVHGGIQATLADETGGWFLHALEGTAGMTRELVMRYHAPAISSDSPFELTARLTVRERRSAHIEVTLHGASGTLFSTARVEYAVFPEEVARRRLSFPGKEAFRP